MQAENNATTAQNGGQEEQPQPPQSRLESFLGVTKSLIVRALIIYFITSFFRRPQPDTTQKVGNQAVANQKTYPAWNSFENGTMFDMWIYISEDIEFYEFNDTSKLVWFQDGLVYGDWYGGLNGDGTYTQSYSFKPSQRLQNNGSIYLHIYVTKWGKSPNPDSGDEYAGKEIGYSRRRVNKFKKIKYTQTHNLLTGETDKTPDQIEKAKVMSNEILSHWHPNLTINLVVDQTNWVKG